MTSETVYWIWLQTCFGVDNPRVKAALEYFGGAMELYYSKEKSLRSYGGFTERELSKLLVKDLSYSESTVKSCEELGFDAVCIGEEGYPRRLMKTDTPPVMLYIKGKLPSEKKHYVGIVGTRYPLDGSRAMAYTFGYELAAAGACVVSGGAIGIDHGAHEGAVDSGGCSICVPGCGIDKYSNRDMTELIMNRLPENGAIVSEYPPGYPPTKYTFPMRNRIISGLSDCTLIVQAGAGSGAMITAKYALEQKRKIFVMPGAGFSDRTSGTNMLLKNGFTAALNHQDILRWLQRQALTPDFPDEFNPPFTPGLRKQISARPHSQSAAKDYSSRHYPPPIGYLISMTLNDLSDDEQYSAEADEDEIQLSVVNEDESVSASEITESPQHTEEPRENDIESAAAVAEEGSDGARLPGGKVFDPRSIPGWDYASPEYRDFLRRKFRYDESGEESPYTELDKDFILGLFEPAVRDYSDGFPKKSDAGRKSPAKRKKRSDFARTKTEKITPSAEKASAGDEAGEKTVSKSAEKPAAVGQTEQLREEKEGQKGKNDENLQEILSKRLTENALTVYHTISDAPVSAGTIKVQTGLSIADVMTALTELQMAGLAEVKPGGKYAKK